MRLGRWVYTLAYVHSLHAFTIFDKFPCDLLNLLLADVCLLIVILCRSGLQRRRSSSFSIT